MRERKHHEAMTIEAALAVLGTLGAIPIAIRIVASKVKRGSGR